MDLRTYKFFATPHCVIFNRYGLWPLTCLYFRIDLKTTELCNWICSFIRTCFKPLRESWSVRSFSRHGNMETDESRQLKRVSFRRSVNGCCVDFHNGIANRNQAPTRTKVTSCARANTQTNRNRQCRDSLCRTHSSGNQVGLTSRKPVFSPTDIHVGNLV